MKTAELRCAYAYDCEQCGRENFVRAVPSDDPADAEPLRPFTAGWVEQHQWFTIPARVRCAHCGEEYATVEID
jgi:DNA-directed RNA polymerase subunit RPC12/RpoP